MIFFKYYSLQSWGMPEGLDRVLNKAKIKQNGKGVGEAEYTSV